MRLLIIALLLGLSGGVVAYVQFEQKHRGKRDTFEDPIVRIARIMESRGEEAKDLANIPRAKISVVNGAKFDFGQMSRHSKRSHTFVLKNMGNSPSRLKVANSSCKCTIGALTKNELQPGEEAEVELTWTAETSEREFGQSATIETDDPEQPELKLTISGKVEDRIFYEPAGISLGDFSSATSLKRQFYVFSDFDKPLELTNMRWGHKPTAEYVKFDYSVRPVTKREFPDLEALYVAEVHVEFVAGMPNGPFESAIYFETNVDFGRATGADAKPVTHQVGFVGRVESQLKVIAGTNFNEINNIFEVGRIASSQGKIFKFLISVTADEADKVTLEVDDIRPDESIDVRIGTPTIRENRAIFPVELEVPKGAPPVSYTGVNQSNFGRIMFRTNLEFSKLMPVYLRLEVEDK